jgi:hypothetical protein
MGADEDLDAWAAALGASTDEGLDGELCGLEARSADLSAGLWSMSVLVRSVPDDGRMAYEYARAALWVDAETQTLRHLRFRVARHERGAS